MENNYNINLNQSPLTDQQVDQHKDFDALLEAFETAAPPEQPVEAPQPAKRLWLRYTAGAVAAALLGAIFYMGFLDGSANKNTIPSASAFYAAQPFVNPPKLNVKPSYDKKGIDANKGGVFEFENGSKIIVPPASFTDSKGNIVTGEVDIKYREFHDFVDFFVSGIPMHYDSSGTKYFLESAGMLEVYAEQNGERLNIAPDKNIDVELVSEIMVPSNNRASIPQFNIYELDTTARNWVYRGIDNIELVEEEDIMAILSSEENAIEEEHQSAVKAIETKEKQELAKIEATIKKPTAPVRPQRAKEDAMVFNFELDEEFEATSDRFGEGDVVDTENEIADLKRQQYANQLWQVSPRNEAVNENASRIQWDDFQLKPLSGQDYELTLTKGATSLKIIVNPVLAGTDYDNAIADFNAQFAGYQKQIEDREAQLAEQKKALAERIRLEKAAADENYQEKLAVFRKNGREDLATNEMVKQKIINRFNISQFGIWNCDRPLPPYVLSVKGEFIDNKKNQKFKGNQVYLADKKRNTVYSFYCGEKANITFDSKSDNMMWLVTEENKLAVFTPEKFGDINKKQKRHTFVMNVVDQSISSEEDVRKILDF